MGVGWSGTGGQGGPALRNWIAGQAPTQATAPCYSPHPAPTPPTHPPIQEPILALRRQLASLSGAAAEAGECWLQLAQLCRGTGHYEAATTAVLEAVASKVPWAPLEHVQLLWDKGQPYRAVSEAQVLAQQAQEHRLAAPFASEKDHSRFHAQVGGVAEHRMLCMRCQESGSIPAACLRSAWACPVGDAQLTAAPPCCLPLPVHNRQVALQLAQWMAETGQAAKDEITGG